MGEGDAVHKFVQILHCGPLEEGTEWQKVNSLPTGYATCLQFEPSGTFQKELVSSQLLPVVKKGATVDLSSTFNFET